MFANSYQSGFISIFYSVGSNPLALWDKQVKNGHIRRIVDDEVKSLVLDISGSNVATTYITCPIKPRASLGIKLPFFVMIIKNMKKYFTFEIQILDDKEMHRRFRVSNFQSSTKVKPFCTTMPIGLSSGWNQVQFNLADFTKRAYGSTYVETMRVQVHANVRIRRLYFTDTLYTDEELPNEFKLFGPMSAQKKKEAEKKPSKEQVVKEETKPPEEVPPPPSPVDTAVPEDVKSRAEVESKAGEEAEEATGEPIEARPSEAGAASEGAPSEGAPSEAGDEGGADEEGGGGIEEGAELISEGPGEDEMAPAEPTTETAEGVTEEGGEATEPIEDQAEGAPTPTEGGEEALTDTEAEEEGAEAPPPE